MSIDSLRILALLLSLSVCQCERSASTVTAVHQSLETFAKDLLKEIVHEENEDGRYNRNLVVSPLGVWSLSALITEGSRGNTEQQLRNSLKLPANETLVRQGYRSIMKATVLANRNSTLLEWGNAIFTDINSPVSREYEYIVENYYSSTVRGIDLLRPSTAAEEVNSWVDSATHGRIRKLISAGEIDGVELIMGNAVFFQGAWALPFNSTFTVNRKFYADYRPALSSPDEQERLDRVHQIEETVVADVPMMYQTGPFRVAVSDALKAEILELPYEGNKWVMLVVLPKKGTSLAEVFENLRSHSLYSLFQILETQGTSDDGDRDNIDVFLPRFKINTRVQLKEHLQKLGVVDLFDAAACDLSKMSARKLYVSKMIHQAEIKVTEEGTVASGVTVATINNFSMPTSFNANHPFLFIVVEKSTKAIIFAGKVSNPNLS